MYYLLYPGKKTRKKKPLEGALWVYRDEEAECLEVLDDEVVAHSPTEITCCTGSSVLTRTSHRIQYSLDRCLSSINAIILADDAYMCVSVLRGITPRLVIIVNPSSSSPNIDHLVIGSFEPRR